LKLWISLEARHSSVVKFPENSTFSIDTIINSDLKFGDKVVGYQVVLPQISWEKKIKDLASNTVLNQNPHNRCTCITITPSPFTSPEVSTYLLVMLLLKDRNRTVVLFFCKIIKFEFSKGNSNAPFKVNDFITNSEDKKKLCEAFILATPYFFAYHAIKTESVYTGMKICITVVFYS